ncbi:MAG: VPLPA-CTERM sorting domain-containing protein [Pedobacter sp.]
MNHLQTMSLSLLLASLGAMPAIAAMSGNDGSDNRSIETVSNGAASQHLDDLLGGGNHSDLFAAVHKRHADAALPAFSIMEGHFEGEGGEQPVGLTAMPSAPSASSAGAPNLSLSTAVRMGSGEQTNSAQASVASPSSSTPDKRSFVPTVATTTDTSFTIDITEIAHATPVPLPAAILLFASGLVGLPIMRRVRLQQN